MKWIFIWIIRFYQRFISPLKRTPTCRFIPTCSAYGLEAFQKRGFFVGLALTVWRILRCHPFCVGGYDPVPERGFYRRTRPSRADNDLTASDEPPLACEDYVMRRERKQSKRSRDKQP